MNSLGVRQRFNKLISVILIIGILMTLVPLDLVGASFAVPMGDDIDVTNIRLTREHNGFNTVGAFVEITGSGLAGKTIRFEKAGIGGGLQEMGQKVIDEDTFVKFTFTPEDAALLTGVVRIGTTDVNMQLGSFPNLSGIDRENVNVSKYDGTGSDPASKLNITGNNLTAIGTSTSAIRIEAKYGRVQTRTFHPTDSYADFGTSGKVILTEPPLPGEKGFQNIVISKTDTSAGYTTQVEYLYGNVFRFMEDLGVTNPTMFPNTGAKGDYVNFTAPDFLDTKNYNAYFLKTLDGSDKFTEKNKGEFVALELGPQPADEDKLIIKVPDHADFNLQSYFVVLTHTVNNEIIAEQVIRDSSSNPEQFTVIGSGFKPTIESVFPKKGPDTGANVQISGRNILTLNLPDLTANGNFKDLSPALNPTGQDSDKILHIVYDETGALYKTEPVTITRDVKVQIGKEAFFVKNADNTFNISKGLPDSILVRTDTIDDALTDPFKDVVLEIKTVITETKVGGNTYIFSQVVTKQDGYEFEPSTLTPVVTDVTPDTIQIETFNTTNKFAEDTLIAIKGSSFLVDKEVDDDGNSFTRYPTVLIKKNNDNTFLNKYQLGFFPNEEVDGVRGIIKYKDDENGVTETVLRDSDNNVVPLNITVVDANNKIVDGTEDNDVGTKILIKIPNISLLKDGGIKHVQVTNPRRQSSVYGASTIKSDSLSFIKTSDVPVIEAVDPQITTVEGDVEVTVTGANFQDGVRMFLDGEEITGFSRDIAPDGEKILLKFTAPAGRAGTTQLQVINPDGGLAVKDFTYVTSFAKDPTLEDFNPKVGTDGSLVVIDGDNYLRPDPTAPNTTGYDGLRLLGTRVFLDGKDVNQYNYDSLGNVKFIPYTSPSNQAAIYSQAGRALYSPFYENVLVTKQSDSKVFYLGKDKSDNPRITNNDDEWYDIRRNAVDTGFEAYNASGTLVGAAAITYNSGNGQTTVAITGGPTFIIQMDNKLIHIKKDAAGVNIVDIADYSESIVLTDGTSYYTLYRNFEGDIRLTNGKDNVYTIKRDNDNNKFVATKDTSGTQDLVVAADGTKITIGSTDLTYLTAYTVNSDNGEITGDRTTVISKNQVTMRVPGLTTGKGYKDIRVVNPDTKYAEKTGEEGFYYVTQPSSNPVITKIDPNKGAVDGGYAIDIFGNDFQEGMRVFIDSVEVPQEDIAINIAGDEVRIRVPKYKRDLIATYGVDKIDVAVVVLNKDGGSDFDPKGFKYIIPVSSPNIDRITPVTGSATGGEIVEIFGFEFRYFEPYQNKVGGAEYNPGDPFEDLHANSKWDDLLDINSTTDADNDGFVDIITKVPDSQTPYFNYYLESKVLPKVFFGEEEAKIVEFSKGYMKVITPKRAAGQVEVSVVNNDLGVSNKVSYTFESSSPTVATVSPNKGRKQGVEIKDIYGADFKRSTIKGYMNDDDDTIVEIPNVNTIVRFADIDNKEIQRDLPNSGLIYNQRTSVELDGGLRVVYDGAANTIQMSIEENGKVYTRTFNNYDDSDLYFPAEMLKAPDNKYYTPNGYLEGDGTTYSNKVFEYVRMYIEDKRLIVERGYAPKVVYDNVTHLIVTTPSYHTIDPVKITITNPDGGTVQADFTYTNPDSNPKIKSVGAKVISPDQTYWMVEGAVNGAIEIEIIGLDLRENAQVRVGEKTATVQERTSKTIDDVLYDVLIVTVPTGTDTDINQKYPVLVENEDSGIANSATLDNLIGPNYGANTIPFYFIYRKPLSAPTIETITPNETSVYGGHEIVITGKDFRAGAIVIVGTVGGIPITDVTIENNGTLIKFNTPNNMVVGDKAVVVKNADFGQAIAEGGLKVVSYPIINEVLNEAGDGAPGRLSVEGNQKIRINGTGFQEGAKVIFSGTRSERTDTTTVGEFGLWRDDKYYIVENGTAAAAVEFVDSQTLIVTTPELNKEEDLTITIINADSGISDGDTTVEYSQPVPQDPIGLKVEMIEKHFIRLYDYASDGVEYYEIYYNISDKSLADLKKNDYLDFKYLDTTNLEPYKITKLPGFEKAEKGDKIHFVLRAVNKFGMSDYSNVAFLTYKDFEDVEYIGEPDVDGGLEVEPGKDYRHIAVGDESLIDLAGEKLPPKLEIDLREFEFNKAVIRVINVPAKAVQESGTVVYINYGDLKIQFIPQNLNTTTFRQMNFVENTYGQIQTGFESGAYSSLLQGDIPRGQRMASSVFKIGYNAVNNSQTKAFNTINGQMDVVLPYDTEVLRSSDEASIKLYKYDVSKQAWVFYPANLNTQTDEVHARVESAGYYMLLADR